MVLREPSRCTARAPHAAVRVLSESLSRCGIARPCNSQSGRAPHLGLGTPTEGEYAAPEHDGCATILGPTWGHGSRPSVIWHAPGQEYPDTDWYLWIDSDTMIINPTFNLPLHKLKGKDLVIWGNETALLAGDGRSGALKSLLGRAVAWPLGQGCRMASWAGLSQGLLGRLLRGPVACCLPRQVHQPASAYSTGCASWQRRPKLRDSGHLC